MYYTQEIVFQNKNRCWNNTIYNYNFGCSQISKATSSVQLFLHTINNQEDQSEFSCYFHTGWHIKETLDCKGEAKFHLKAVLWVTKSSLAVQGLKVNL